MMIAPDSTAAGAMAAMADPSIWTEDAISAPSLGLYAEKSRAATRELVEKIFPNVEYHEIPGADHFLMLEKPDEFNRLLLDFLNKLK
jgi:pimeloyl-ACP methyl ester carboxylesterase